MYDDLLTFKDIHYIAGLPFHISCIFNTYSICTSSCQYTVVAIKAGLFICLVLVKCIEFHNIHSILFYFN